MYQSYLEEDIIDNQTFKCLDDGSLGPFLSHSVITQNKNNQSNTNLALDGSVILDSNDYHKELVL
jgi:hypothetical protein